MNTFVRLYPATLLCFQVFFIIHVFTSSVKFSFIACGSKDFGAATSKESGKITLPGGTLKAGAYEAYLIKQDSPPYYVDASTGAKFSVV